MSQTFGRYVLLERLATGGMAEIYKAAFTGEGDFRKICVLKRILPILASDEDFIRMFQEEAALTVRLSHANVVQVFDFGREGTDWYLAMEYVRGISLRQALNRCRDRKELMEPRLALYITQETTKGLGHAHSRVGDSGEPLGIVHRDVSPSNILLSWEGEVKITDFGIARMASRIGHTVEGMVRGKAAYLSPEQAEGLAVDGRSDLFSAGVVLWEMLCGKKLFEGDSPTETMGRVMSGPIPSPSSISSAVSPEVDALVAKMLDRQPGKRFANAVEQERAISTLLAAMGGATAADLAAFIRGRFTTEIEQDRTSARTERAAAAAAPAPARIGGTGLTQQTSTWLQDHDRTVEPLPPKERRKLFDLPEVQPASEPKPGTASPPGAPAPHFLELDTGLAGSEMRGKKRVVARIRVGTTTAHIVRASAVAVVAMGILTWAISTVYRR